jgi:hypothetical protein
MLGVGPHGLVVRLVGDLLQLVRSRSRTMSRGGVAELVEVGCEAIDVGVKTSYAEVSPYSARTRATAAFSAATASLVAPTASCDATGPPIDCPF